MHALFRGGGQASEQTGGVHALTHSRTQTRSKYFTWALTRSLTRAASRYNGKGTTRLSPGIVVVVVVIVVVVVVVVGDDADTRSATPYDHVSLKFVEQIEEPISLRSQMSFAERVPDDVGCRVRSAVHRVLPPKYVSLSLSIYLSRSRSLRCEIKTGSLRERRHTSPPTGTPRAPINFTIRSFVRTLARTRVRSFAFLVPLFTRSSPTGTPRASVPSSRSGEKRRRTPRAAPHRTAPRLVSSRFVSSRLALARLNDSKLNHTHSRGSPGNLHRLHLARFHFQKYSAVRGEESLKKTFSHRDLYWQEGEHRQEGVGGAKGGKVRRDGGGDRKAGKTGGGAGREGG